MTSAKAKILKCVEDYIALCPDEFGLFKEHMRTRRDSADNEYAHVKGTDTDLRGLHEVPVTLYNMLQYQLSETEWQWFHGDGKEKVGAKWFALEFPVFRIPDKY